MISFLKGIIEYININSIIIDVNGVGYEVFVAKVDNYKLKEEVFVHTYQYVREDGSSLYGFSSLDEKRIFLKLTSVKGIGVKTAISMLSKSSPDMLIQAIEVGNISYLKQLPGIGAKAAQQIVLDLKGQLKLENEITLTKQSKVFKEAKEGLKELGFKAGEIDSALSNIKDGDISVDAAILKALQFLNRK